MEDCQLRSCADCEGGGARHSEKGRTEERGAGVDRGGQTWQISKSFTTNFDPTCPLQVKAAWLADLEELIERISAKFSAHFASMGFAGQVSVKRFVGSDKSSLHAQAIKLDAQKSFSLNDTGHNSRRPCLTHSSVFTFPRCSFTEASLRMISRTMEWTSW